MLSYFPEYATMTIASGQSISAGIALGEKTLVGIAMPAGWDAASLTFQVSADDGVTWRELRSTSGAVAYTTAAAGHVAFNADEQATWRGVNRLKVRSGTSGSPVNQTADRIITLVLKTSL